MRYFKRYGNNFRIEIDPENGDITIKTKVHPDEIETFVTLVRDLHRIGHLREWGPEQ